MRPPRLIGPTVALLPVTPAQAEAVVGGDPLCLDLALRAAGLRAAPGWPHQDTSTALVPVTHTPDAPLTWLVTVAGEVVGECGWTAPPDRDGTVEIGYGLAGPSRGRGIGTEAVALLVAWTDRQPGVRAVAADVLVGNTASRRLLRRLGFVERAPEGRWVRAERGEVRLRGRHVC